MARLRELGVHHIRGGFFASGNAGWQARQAAAYRDAYAAGIRSNLVLDLRCSPTGLVDPCLAGVKAELPRGSVESVEWLNEHDLFGGTTGRTCCRPGVARSTPRSRRIPSALAAGHRPVAVAPQRPAGPGRPVRLPRRREHPPLHRRLQPEPAAHRRRAARGSRPSPGQSRRGDRGRLPHLAGRDERRPAGRRRADGRRLHAAHRPRALRGRIDRTYLYELIDQRVNLLDSDSNYGLLHTLHAQARVHAAQEPPRLIGSSAPAQVTPVGFSIAGDTSDARTLVLQQDDGRYALVVWRTASVWDRDAKRRLTVAPRRYVVTIPSATAGVHRQPRDGHLLHAGRAERRQRHGRRRRRPAGPPAHDRPADAPAGRPAADPRRPPTRPPTPRRPPTRPTDPPPPARPTRPPTPPARRPAHRPHAAGRPAHRPHATGRPRGRGAAADRPPAAPAPDAGERPRSGPAARRPPPAGARRA